MGDKGAVALYQEIVALKPDSQAAQGGPGPGGPRPGQLGSGL